METLKNAYIITGPTCSGKTNLAIQLAKKINGQIICMDSMTLYRCMDVGTAKPTNAERVSVPHHAVDVLDPNQSSNVSSWLKLAKDALNKIISDHSVPIFVGGTPMYLKALVYGIFESPPIEPSIRKALEDRYSPSNTQEAHKYLKQVDPESASRIHINDLRRILRALEVFESTKKKLSEFQNQWKKSSIDKINCVYIQLDRKILYDRIHKRTLILLENGWIQETKNLLEKYPDLGKEARQAIGYQEIIGYLNGSISYEKMIDSINLRTRHLAKKQETWFRHLDFCSPWDPNSNPDLWGIPLQWQ